MHAKCDKLQPVNCDEWFCRTLGHSLEQKRAYLAQRLEKIGFNILPAQGSYFLMADIRLGHADSIHMAWHVLADNSLIVVCPY